MLEVATVQEELRAFERGELDPETFPHREHLRLAYEMLRRRRFGDTVTRFSQGLRRLATNAGKPEMYNETITVAFLALVNERRARRHSATWEQFIAANPDLLNKDFVRRWYDPALLESELARTTFLLPPLHS